METVMKRKKNILLEKQKKMLYLKDRAKLSALVKISQANLRARQVAEQL